MSPILVFILLFILVLVGMAIFSNDDNGDGDLTSPKNRTKPTPPQANKSTATELSQAELKRKQEQTDKANDKLSKLAETAQIIVGAKHESAQRGYQGETLSVTRTIHRQIEQGYQFAAELGKRLKSGNDNYTSQHVDALIPQSYKGSKLSDIPWETLNQHLDELNKDTHDKITHFEQTWATISAKLDSIDERIKLVQLDQITMSNTLQSDLPSFHMHEISKSWKTNIQQLTSHAYSTSRKDPIQVTDSQIPAIEKRLNIAEEHIKVVSKAARTSIFDIQGIKQSLSKQDYATTWVDDALSSIGSSINLNCESSAQALEENLQELLDSCEQIQSAISRLQEQETIIKETLPAQIKSSRNQIASHCNLSVEDVMREDGGIASMMKSNEKQADDARDAIQNGNLEHFNEEFFDLVKKIDDTQTLIQKVNKAALNGQDQLSQLFKRYQQFKQHNSQEINSITHSLQGLNLNMLHKQLVENVQQASHTMKQLDQEFEQASLELKQGQFVSSLSSLIQIEHKLESLESLADNVLQLQDSIKKLEQENTTSLTNITARLEVATEKMRDSFVSEETHVHFNNVTQLIHQTQKESLHANDLKDPRTKAATLHNISEQLSSLEASVLMDDGLYQLLETKAASIEKILQRAKEYIHTSQHDGIPDSQRTTELVKAVEDKLTEWETYKPKLKSSSHWNMLSFELDLFIQSTEVIAISFDSELSKANQASDTLKSASYELRQVADWRGHHGERVDLTEPSNSLHQGYISLSKGNYSEALKSARETEIQIRDQRHLAKSKATDSEVKEATLRSRVLGTETPHIHNHQTEPPQLPPKEENSSGRKKLYTPPSRRGPEPNPIDSFNKRQRDQESHESNIQINDIPELEELG